MTEIVRYPTRQRCYFVTRTFVVRQSGVDGLMIVGECKIDRLQRGVIGQEATRCWAGIEVYVPRRNELSDETAP